MSMAIVRKWYSTAEVAEMLGYGLTKTKFLVLSGQIRSSRTGPTGASSPNGWTTTSAAVSRNRPGEQASERGSLDLPLP